MKFIPSLPVLAFMAMLINAEASADILPDQADTVRLQEWRSLKYGMFLHFGMSTFSGKEIDPGNQPSAAYAPERVDADQWIRVARDAGMRYAVLTAKHVSGHCLWDSRVPFHGREFDYDVATSGNTNDVVRAFVEACGKYNIVPGLYYCLLDTHNNTNQLSNQCRHGVLPEDFFELAKAQLTELARQYPAVRYFWIDIPRAASLKQRAELYDLLRRENPRCIVLFNCGFLDKKAAAFTVEGRHGDSWPTDILNSEREVIPGVFDSMQSWQGVSYHLGYEHCDVVGKDWFWTSGDQARSTDVLYQLYHDTVIRAGGNLLLDVGPDQKGRLEEWQIQALMSLKQRIVAGAGAMEKK